MSVVTNRQAYYVRIIVLLFSDLYNYIHDAAKTENNKSTATASYIFGGLIPEQYQSINCENENAPKRIKDINNRLLGWIISRKKDMHHG